MEQQLALLRVLQAKINALPHQMPQLPPPSTSVIPPPPSTPVIPPPPSTTPVLPTVKIKTKAHSHGKHHHCHKARSEERKHKKKEKRTWYVKNNLLYIIKTTLFITLSIININRFESI